MMSGIIRYKRVPKVSGMQLNKDDFLKTILLIGCGAFIHVSALFFLLVPFSNLLLLRHIKFIHLASFFVIPYVIMYSSEVMLYLSSFLENSYYSTYGELEAQGGATLYIALMEMLSLFCYVAFFRADLKKNKRLSLMYIMLPLLTEQTYMINTGVYILNPELIDEIPEGEFFHITHLMEKIKKRDGRIGCFPVSEHAWRDMGEWPEYLKMINVL